MKNFRLLIIGLLFLILSFSCITTTEKKGNFRHTWLGRDIGEIVAMWGYQDTQVRAPNGNDVYIYDKSYESQEGVRVKTPAKRSRTKSWNADTGEYTYGYVYTPARRETKYVTVTKNCVIFFEINNFGKIVEIKFKGDGCRRVLRGF